MKKKKIPIYLLLVNFIPIFGIIFMNWTMGNLLLIYWVENIVIGFFNLFKIALARGETYDLVTGKQHAPVPILLRIIMILFFIFNFGIFTLVHGMFVVMLFSFESSGKMDLLIEQKDLYPMFLMFISFMISHGISFFVNYIGKKEYENMDIGKTFFLPYGRVSIMHLCVFFGTFIFILLRVSSLFGLVIIILKTYLDSKLHLWEHLLSSNKVISKQ